MYSFLLRLIGLKAILNRIKHRKKWFKSSIGLFRQIEVFDENGKRVYDTKLKPCHSLTIAFLEHIESLVLTEDKASKAVNASTYNISRTTRSAMLCLNIDDAGATEDDWGIMVGTGSTTEDNEDYVMETKIVHGGGAGQLEYEAHAHTDTVVNGAYVDFEIRRTFTNSSGGSITVNEVGIYVKTERDVGTNYYWMIAHDLTGGVAVADTQTLSVKYVFRTMV